MHKIKSTIFIISKEEIIEIISEMIKEKLLKNNFKLNKKQIIKILSHVEGDEMLAKDIHNSIRDSICTILNI